MNLAAARWQNEGGRVPWVKLFRRVPEVRVAKIPSGEIGSQGQALTTYCSGRWLESILRSWQQVIKIIQQPGFDADSRKEWLKGKAMKEVESQFRKSINKHDEEAVERLEPGQSVLLKAGMFASLHRVMKYMKKGLTPPALREEIASEDSRGFMCCGVQWRGTQLSANL